jgi:hypothetical protein
MIASLKKYYQHIISFFEVPEPVKVRAENTIKQENSVSFIIDEWNRLIIKVGLDNKNTSSCEAFGKMLFLVNNGEYEQNILNIMVDMTKKNPDQTEYVQTTMISWASSITDQIESDTLIGPQIRPTEVFSGRHNAT